MTPLNKLRWQCRRGTKELDLMLLRYLDTEYLQADSSEQAQFTQLLSQEDDWLFTVLLGNADAGQLQTLISKIKQNRT